MSLFATIPGSFFSVLSSGNKEIYLDAIMLLHQMFKYELNIRVDDYITSLIALIEDKEFTPEADDDTTEGSLTPNVKARLILNRLVKTGWVDKEFLDGSFIEIITPQDYAIQVMKLLSELNDHTLHEYNSLVFATYSSLKQAKEEHRGQMYEAVLSAKANTERLTYELKSLYHGIRSYLRRPAKRKFLQSIANNIPNTCNWYHWSDIDYGGFSMLARLRREIKNNVIPYRMNKSELIKYSSLTASVTPKYLEKLGALKLREALDDCQACIDYMIEKRIKLEQEAMLTDQSS